MYTAMHTHIHIFYFHTHIHIFYYVPSHTYTHSTCPRALIFLRFFFLQGGGLGALNWGERDLVQEPIPVRVEDGWLR